MATTVVPQGTSGSGGGTSITTADVREYGIRVDWKDVATITIQPGQRLADDGTTTFTVATGFDVTFADIDTGAEASSTGYYVWLTGDASAVLSLSATAPTGVSGGKYLAGWVWNDSGSDLYEFRTEVIGDALDYRWVAGVAVLAESTTHATTYTAINTATSGAAPSALVDGLHLTMSAYDATASANMYISADGTADYAAIDHYVDPQNSTWSGFVPTQGSTVWWKRANNTGSKWSIINVQGFRIDRSGVTYA